MNDLELMVALYRGLADFARITPLDSWGDKRLVVYTPIQNHNGYYFTCIVIKDVNLITTIPQLIAGSYEEVSSVISQYKSTQGVKIIEISQDTLYRMFDNQYKLITNNSNLFSISGKAPLEIVATAIDQAFNDYQIAMGEFTRQYPGMTSYQLSMLLPSWTYRSATMYKPFGFNLFTSTSGIDIIHNGIEIAPNGAMTYINTTQLSGEVVRSVKHDNIV